MARQRLSAWARVLVAAGAAWAAAFPAGAGADVSLGTENGIAYVEDQTPAVGTGSASPIVFARCTPDRELVGGGVALNYGGTGAHVHWIYPTTTEGAEGSYALSFWNNSGSSLVGTATAACARNADPFYRGEAGDLFSAGDTLALTATCPEARRVSGGGVFMSLAGADEGVISSSYPVDDGDEGKVPDDGWKVRVRSRAGTGGPTTAYAICTDRPRFAYREKAVELAVGDANQPSVSCAEGRPAVSAGVKVAGRASEAILNRLETYDGGDKDLAPDDGGWAHVANTLETRRATVHVICKREP